MDGREYVLGLLLVFIITALLTPLVRRYALRCGLVDHPHPRRLNRHPMPTGGGAAIFVAFFLVAGLLLPEKAGAYLPSGIILLTLGFVDDSRGVSPGVKLLCQAVAALLFVFLGARIDFVTNPFGGMLYLGSMAVPVTIVWLIGVTNAVNLVDGVDGLAAGITCIAAAALFVIAYELGRLEVALLLLLLVGACLGFLPYNFSPARLYLGDTGAMFLGFMLAALAVEGALKGAATIGMTAPLLILALPVGDTLFAIVRRLYQRVPLFQADKGHFHHRLLARGLSQRQTALLGYGISSACAGFALWLQVGLRGLEWIVSAFVLALAAALLVSLLIRSTRPKSERRVL